MEPRNEESNKLAKTRVDQRKRRFHIDKLEERIAPRLNDGCLGHFNPHGKCVGR